MLVVSCPKEVVVLSFRCTYFLTFWQFEYFGLKEFTLSFISIDVLCKRLVRKDSAKPCFHLNTRPFNNQTAFCYSNIWVVWYSDHFCIQFKPYILLGVPLSWSWKCNLIMPPRQNLYMKIEIKCVHSNSGKWHRPSAGSKLLAALNLAPCFLNYIFKI